MVVTNLRGKGGKFMVINPGVGLDKKEITSILNNIGMKYGFYVDTEIHTGFSLVDVVWFDERIKPIWTRKNKRLENSLALPIVGFEIEEKTFARKTIRGDIDSLNSLSPQFGVLVLSNRIKNVTLFNQQHKNIKKKSSKIT